MSYCGFLLGLQEKLPFSPEEKGERGCFIYMDCLETRQLKAWSLCTTTLEVE